MVKTVRIVSTAPGGELSVGGSVRVLAEGGAAIEGVRSVDVRIRPGDIVQAEVSLLVGGLDVHAHPLLSLETVKAAAAAHGYRLVEDRYVEISTIHGETKRVLVRGDEEI